MLIFVIFSIIFFHFEIIWKTKSLEKGFNNTRLDKTSEIKSKCQFKEFYFPYYDLGINYLFWPLHIFLNKDCPSE